MKRVLVASLALLLVVTACGGNEQAPAAPAQPEPAEEVEPEPEPDPQPEPQVDDQPEPEPAEPEDTRPRSPLTGRPVDPDVLEQPVLVAKIENSPQSRPQSGLDAADVVFEEVVEGGVTRFFALFHSDVPRLAGPIRSARPVDAQLLAGYGGAGFAYSGARPEVLGMLSGTTSVRITEGGAGFFRDPTRGAPHNLYIDASTTRDGAADRDAEAIGDVGWSFTAEPPSGELLCPQELQDCEDPGRGVDIAMSWDFSTGWEFDATHGVYRRSQNDAPFVVTGAGTIGAANVVVLATRHYIGASGYPETDVVTDDAPAIVLRDGRRYEARWSKPSASDPIRVLTASGEPFPFKPGPTWIHLPDAASMPSIGD